MNIKDFQQAPGRRAVVAETKTPAGKSSWDFLNKEITLFGSPLPDRIKENFYLELATLLPAGVDIRSALELIGGEMGKKKHRAIFAAILREVEGGASLSAALQKRSEFTAYEYYSVRIGEETGKLSHILKELALFFQKKIRQRQQITGALTYPVLVLVVAVSAVSFMMAYVVPMFADVFKRFGGELPFVTKAVLHGAGLAKRLFPVFILLVAGLVVFVYMYRKKTWYRRSVSAAILRVPLIGAIVRKIYIARFANTMSLLVGARIPIIQGIALVRQMIGYYPVEASLQQAEEKIMLGHPLYKSLEAHSVYPRKMISLLKAGEEVNQLELFFARIAEQYSTEVEYQTNMLSKFLEPLIIIVLGLIVGVILVAMYLPLFKMGQNF